MLLNKLKILVFLSLFLFANIIFANNDLATYQNMASCAQIIKVRAGETFAGNNITAVYMNIINNCEKELIILNVNSNIAKKAKIHLSNNKLHDMSTMIELENLKLTAKQTLKLSPGGYHIMLIDLIKPLKQGDSIPLEILFSDGSKKNINALIMNRI